jgi:2-polyprenyl-3-methyl-5-hydroxy-6-metoxy-1,4-benzoquinol methylase
MAGRPREGSQLTEADSSTVSPEQQVEAEGLLAQRLAHAAPDERRTLYGVVYDQIYDMHLSRDPHTLDFGAGPELVGFLERLTHAGDELLEVGCGGGLLAIEIARRGRRVLGIDVSSRILEQARLRAGPANRLTFATSEGTDIPACDGAFDFVYSVEVLEHLHQEDVSSHLREVHRVLRPGGHYWLLTPNRWDSVTSAKRFGVSADASADIHLKEWTYSELDRELRQAEFTSLRSPWRNARMMWLPLMPVETFVAAERLPPAILRHRSVRSLMGIVACSILARKPPPRAKS